MNSRALRTLFCLSCLSSLCGCSTLRIDVDVYKGPLANEKEVQIRELAALAIGAKPLLIEVRDTLEVGERTGWTLWKWRNRREYRASEMRVRSADGERTFRSPTAEVTNSILGIFRDVDEGAPFGAERRELRELIDDYGASLDVTNSEGEQALLDRSLWTRIVRARPQVGAARPGKPELFAALGSYLMPEPGKFRNSATLLQELAKSLEEGEKPEEKKRNDALFSIPGSPVSLRDLEASEWQEVGANVCYTILNNDQIWSKIAGVIPATHPALRAELSRRGQAIAAAFLTARAQIRKIMLTSARIAMRVADEQPTLDGAIDFAEDTLVISTSCVSRAALKTFLSDAKRAGVEKETRELVENLEELLLDALSEEDLRGIAATRAVTRRLLDAMIRSFHCSRGEAVQRLANAIIDVDHWCKSNGPEHEAPSESPSATGLDATVQMLQRDFSANGEEKEKVKKKEWSDPAKTLRFSFGLATGPVTDLRQAGSLFVASSDLAVSLDDHGLAGGRDPRGIDGLTTEYLTANENGREQLERRLLTALVQFAVKIRLLSGMQPLLGNDSVEQSYIDVLQAVANSIITQTDALQRETHLLDSISESSIQEARRKAATKLEKAARQRAGNAFPAQPAPAPNQTAPTEREFGARELLAGGETMPQTPGEVIGELSRRLRYVIAGELARDHESPALPSLRAALEFVEEQSLQTVYLRAASAYLRNSYPAPDLQGEPLHVQDHILRGRAGRVTGGRRRIAAQLDKQFWQNVNSITLKGVGKANYALIKDDIGNWQVKSYDADPGKLVQSLASLARLATSAGVSPAAVVGAAEMQKLLGRVRRGKTLGEPDQERVNKLEEQRAKASAEDRATESALRGAIARGRELNAELRTWLGKEFVAAVLGKLNLETAAADALRKQIVDVIPGEGATVANAGLVEQLMQTGEEFGRLLRALATDIPAAVGDASKATVSDEARPHLVAFRTRRLDLLRGLQLVLLDEPATGDQAEAR